MGVKCLLDPTTVTTQLGAGPKAACPGEQRSLLLFRESPVCSDNSFLSSRKQPYLQTGILLIIFAQVLVLRGEYAIFQHFVSKCRFLDIN